MINTDLQQLVYENLPVSKLNVYIVVLPSPGKVSFNVPRMKSEILEYFNLYEDLM